MFLFVSLKVKPEPRKRIFCARIQIRFELSAKDLAVGYLMCETRLGMYNYPIEVND